MSDRVDIARRAKPRHIGSCERSALPWQSADRLMIVLQSPQGTLKRSLQLVGRAPDRLVHRFSRVRDRCGLALLESSLDHAAFIILPGLASVFISKVDFHPRDLIAEMDERVLHQLFDMGGETITPAYVPVRADLDVHIQSFRKSPLHVVGARLRVKI